MKQGFALLLAGGLLALTPVAASAQSAVPPFEVLTMLRSTALEPIGRPSRHGAHYVVRAVDRYGEEVRVVVDAYNGRIRTVTPTGHGPRYAAPAPYYGPRVYYGPGPYFGPGPLVVRVLPDDYDDEPGYGPGGYPAPPRAAPPRVSPPQTKAAQRPPLPRARPADSPAAAAPPPEAAPPAPVQAAPEPAPAAEPQPAAGPAPGADGETPPPVGFE